MVSLYKPTPGVGLRGIWGARGLGFNLGRGIYGFGIFMTNFKIDLRFQVESASQLRGFLVVDRAFTEVWHAWRML